MVANKYKHLTSSCSFLLHPSPCGLLCSVQVHPTTRQEGVEGERTHSSTISLTSALGGIEWSTPRPGPFTPGVYCTGGWIGLGEGGGGQSGWISKTSLPSGLEPRTVQPVASRCTNGNITAAADYLVPGHTALWCW